MTFMSCSPVHVAWSGWQAPLLSGPILLTFATQGRHWIPTALQLKNLERLNSCLFFCFLFFKCQSRFVYRRNLELIVWCRDRIGQGLASKTKVPLPALTITYQVFVKPCTKCSYKTISSSSPNSPKKWAYHIPHFTVTRTQGRWCDFLGHIITE
jgi:hypothetical protein